MCSGFVMGWSHDLFYEGCVSNVASRKKFISPTHTHTVKRGSWKLTTRYMCYMIYRCRLPVAGTVLATVRAVTFIVNLN